jgi:hypothetical protein
MIEVARAASIASHLAPRLRAAPACGMRSCVLANIEATLCSSKSEEWTGALAPSLDTGCTIRTADISGCDTMEAAEAAPIVLLLAPPLGEAHADEAFHFNCKRCTLGIAVALAGTLGSDSITQYTCTLASKVDPNMATNHARNVHDNIEMLPSCEEVGSRQAVCG